MAPGDQNHMRDIFLRLTQLDEDVVQGEERRDSRRRVPMEDLVVPGRSYEGTKALVKQLADSRLVVASVNEVTGLEEVEVAHEALIRYWPLLRSWLDGDRELLRLREGVRRAAWEWQGSQRDESYLVHRGKRLQSAQALLAHPRIALNERETAYIQACMAAEAARPAGVAAPSARAATRPARAAAPPAGTESVSWEVIVDRIRRGRGVPILGGWLDFELAVGLSEEHLAAGYSEYIQYSLPGPYRLASLIDYRRIMQHDRCGTDLGFLHFVKALILGAAVRDGVDPETLAEAKCQADEVTVSRFANLLGYPRFGKGADDPQLVLADLPFKTILTTSPFTFIEEALRRAGKQPRTELCRWRKDLDAIAPAIEDDYQPSEGEPLVYHLWGLDEYPDSLVLSEDDCLGYLMAVAKSPEIVHPTVWKSIASFSLLLLGHDLDGLGWRTLEHAILLGRSAPESIFQLHLLPEEKRRALVDAYLRRTGLMPYWGTPGAFLTELWRRSRT